MDVPGARGPGAKQAPEPRFLTVARVRKAWGLRGDLALQLLTERPGRLFQARTVYLDERPYLVERFWRHRQDVLLKLHGCDDRSQAEAWRGRLVQICLDEAGPLDPNEYYTHQLVGLEVVTLEGEPLGALEEILTTGANDVYVVRGPRGEVLIPAHVEFVRQVDLERGVMRVYLMPGLAPG